MRYRIAAPASTRTAIANHLSASFVFTAKFAALGVAVTDAVPVLDAVFPAVMLAVLEVGVADVSIVVTGGIEVTETGPGPPMAERLWLALAESADAGNIASADAVSGTLKMLQISATAWNVVSCSVVLQLFMTHELS